LLFNGFIFHARHSFLFGIDSIHASPKLIRLPGILREPFPYCRTQQEEGSG
jgi:hypothetical protein